MRRVLVVLAVVLCAVCFASFVIAGSVDDAPTSDTAIVMAFSDFPPYKMRIGGEDCGIDVELVRQIAAEMELDFVIKDCDFAQCLDLMQSGEANVMTSLLRRPEREAYIKYVQPRYYNRTAKGFYLLSGQQQRIRQYGDLEGLRIGIKSGARYVPMFDEDHTLNKVEALTMAQLLRMLERGELDTVLATETEANFWIRALGLRGKVVPASFFFDQLDPVYMGIALKSPLAKRAKEFGRVLKKLVDQGEFERLRREYMSKAEELAGQLE